jgi:hypothetical protein
MHWLPTGIFLLSAFLAYMVASCPLLLGLLARRFPRPINKGVFEPTDSGAQWSPLYPPQARIAKVRHLAAGLKLLIVGSGPELPNLEKLQAHLGLADDCIFEPAKTNVAPWMRSIDIFVMSSESESFPNALLEAMTSGCAPVGSRVGGVPELISQNQTGLLFDSGDVEGPARDNFSMEINARRNQALYQTLLERKGLES